jgi:hypothetical protein
MRDTLDDGKIACEETLPTTGQRCGRPTSVWIIRFGERFNLCAECALRDYRRQLGIRKNGQNPN